MIRTPAVCIVASLLANPAAPADGPRINELLASSTTETAEGAANEWIELANPGGAPFDLAGCALSDDPEEPMKWIFPPVSIEAGGFLLIRATGLNQRVPGALHANFRLDRQGETVSLTAPDGETLDALRFPPQTPDYSYGRAPGGSETWLYFRDPTPGSANRTEGRAGFAAAPVASRPGGAYADSVTVELIAREPDAAIHYTLDGSLPDESDSVYSEPLVFDSPAPMRFRAFHEGLWPSAAVTHTYIARDRLDLPLMALTLAPDDLWNRRTGIYANAGQHGREWERPAFVEYMPSMGRRAFGEACGARIHGGASRGRSPRKSFRLYFRDEYGPTHLNFPLFPDSPVLSHNQLVLRGGFNDTWTYDRDMQRETAIYVSDQAARNLFLDMGHASSCGVFAELYLNGEYWGLYNPSERYENQWFAERFGGPEEWDVIAGGETNDGDGREWLELRRWLNRSDGSRDGFAEEAAGRVDVENFTDFVILNVWLQNYDWPHHNWFAARPGNAAGVWRFYPWDVEYSFGSGIEGYQVSQNTLRNALDTGRGTIAHLFSQLVRNEGYVEYFWRRVLFHQQNALRPDHAEARLMELANRVRPAIPAEAARWTDDKTLADYLRAVRLAQEFIEQRPPFFETFLRNQFGPPPASAGAWFLHRR